MNNSLPKIELHLHLDCSLSHAAVKQIDPTFTRERYDETIVVPSKLRHLDDFLERSRNSIVLLQTERALAIAASDLVRQLAAERVIYAEIRFAPLLHTENGLKPEQVVEAVAGAMRTASAEAGIEARLILCTLRHYSEAQSMQTVKLVERYRDYGVVALDIASNEFLPLAPHIPAFRYAQERGLKRTAHAGEICGPESVREALENLQPSRIGHGVRSSEDPALVEQVIAENIHLEVCPTSNVAIDMYEALPDHPINRLYRAGVNLGVNTDGRGMFPLTLMAEYAALHDTFSWTEADLLAVNLNAAAASFAPPAVKDSLVQQLEVAYSAGD